jgi:hypothetical protein
VEQGKIAFRPTQGTEGSSVAPPGRQQIIDQLRDARTMAGGAVGVGGLGPFLTIRKVARQVGDRKMLGFRIARRYASSQRCGSLRMIGQRC